MSLCTLRPRWHACRLLQVLIFACIHRVYSSHNTRSVASRPWARASGVSHGTRVPKSFHINCCPFLIECEQRRMFVSYSHANVSTFSASVSVVGVIFSPNLS